MNLPGVDESLQPLVDIIGDLTLLKYTLSLFLVFPLGMMLRHLPGGMAVKHFFSLSTGVFIVQWVFGRAWIHTLLSSGVTYLLCLLLPRAMAGDASFVFMMGYMTISHIYR